MISVTFEQFEEMSEKGNLIPLYQEIPADLETPVSAKNADIFPIGKLTLLPCPYNPNIHVNHEVIGIISHTPFS